MWISTALAETAAPGAKNTGSDFLTGILPLVLIFVVFYFLLIRPQQKRMKEQRALIAQIKKGDEIMTAGGLIGKVVKAHDGSPTVDVEIADNVRIQVVRSQIAGLWNPQAFMAPPPGTPGGPGAANDKGSSPLKRLFGR